MSTKDYQRLRFDEGSAKAQTFMSFLAMRIRKVSRNFEFPFLALSLMVPPRRFFFEPQWEIVIHAAAVFCLLIALFLRVWSKGYPKGKVFVVEGPYRYVRNPVEISTLMAFLGAGVLLEHSILFHGLLLLAALVWMNFCSLAVDQRMSSSMGPAYLKYRSRVRRWLPSVLPEANRSGVNFSLAHGLREEKNVLLWSVVLALVYAIRLRFVLDGNHITELIFP